MTGHQSTAPAVAVRYFALFGITGHPLIGQTFHPDRGWVNYPFRKHVSGSELNGLRRTGHTFVRLDAGSHRADFSLQEL